MSESKEASRVLIVEDDRDISSVIAVNLESNGIATKQVHDGMDGLKQARSGTFDLFILDIMIPGLDGISLCRRIREADPDTPILMLTAKTEEIELVLSLELGADDYLTKPFSMRELIARIKALLRRSGRTAVVDQEKTEKLHYGNFFIDVSKHKAQLHGEPLDLTVKEFELLSLFIRNPGRAFSRSELLSLIWGYSFEGYEHTVNTHINRLRNKIETDPSHPAYLVTVWGIGYRFVESREAQS
jgi:DNA-binding response OmpR family regulator